MPIQPIKGKIIVHDDAKLLKAREFPIESMYVGNLKRSGKALMGLCPFHKEDTASFAIYPETNSWYCFGEMKGGDSISYYMRKNNCDFKQALEELTR